MIRGFVSARGPRAVSNRKFPAEYSGKSLKEEISNRGRVGSLELEPRNPPSSGERKYADDPAMSAGHRRRPPMSRPRVDRSGTGSHRP